MHHFREALARVLAERVEFPHGAFVTVLDAKVTKATTHSKAVLSVIPSTMEKEVLETLADYEHDIKEGLSEELRLRRIPTLHWAFDHAGEYAEGIDKAIHELKEKGEL